jgi:acetoin utilization protein AcuB
MLVGMLSDRDLAALDVAAVLAAGGADAARRALLRRVVDVMSADVVCAEVETELSDVIDLFLEYKVGAIPVVQPDTRELMGIISYVDVLRAVRDLLDEA